MSDWLGKNEQSSGPEGIMLQRGFKFGQGTIGAIEILLEQSDQHAVFTSILCRPYYEMAARLLWASLAPNGWLRLGKYYAEEDAKVSRAIEGVPQTPALAEHAQKVLADSEKILGQIREMHGEVPTAPSIEQTFREIEQNDSERDRNRTVESFAPFAYNCVYRILSRPIHGHTSAIGWASPGASLPYARLVPLMATRDLVKALLFVAAEEPKKEIESLEKRIIKILRKTGN